MNFDRDEMIRLLESVATGKQDVSGALAAIQELGGVDLGFARIDHQRSERCGFPEVIYGAGKTPEQLAGIAKHFRSRGANMFVTRVSADGASSILAVDDRAEYDALAGTVTSCHGETEKREGTIAVVCAGTSDLDVAGECTNTLSFFGFEPKLVADVGVAGIHRLLARRDDLHSADVVIVIAGMEGALPSVVAGLISSPIIAVPTSVGYGTAIKGFAALFGMLTSCASGVTVVNIDNGFGAACAALRILRTDK